MVEWLTDEERERIAELIAEGASLRTIRREIPRSRHAVARAIKKLMRPPRREPVRAALWLSPAEREEISRGLAAGQSMREIARALGRAPSTVSRDVAAKGGTRRYRACDADRRAVRNLRRPKQAKLADCPRLRAVVEEKLALRWSPQQISGWLVRTFLDDAEMRVSHETIYMSLFVHTKGGFEQGTDPLLAHPASEPTPTRPPLQGGRYGPDQRSGQHPRTTPEVEDRSVPGHWEGDLLFGKDKTAIITLVERQSRFVMLIGLGGRHTADIVADALAAHIVSLPRQLRRSITWDQGKEMAQHARFSIDSGVPVYFCDPRSPWQRGSNEDTNGLLRRYLPRKTLMHTITQAQLDDIAAELNGRPRQTLGSMTPSEALDEALRWPSETRFDLFDLADEWSDSDGCGSDVMLPQEASSCSVDASDRGRGRVESRRDPRCSASGVGWAFCWLGEVGLGDHGSACPRQRSDDQGAGNRRWPTASRRCLGHG